MLEISTWSHITQIAMTFKKQYMVFCNVILKYIFGHSLLYYDSDVLFQVIWTQSPVTYCWQFLSYRITSDWWVTMEHKQNNCLIPTILLKFKNLSQKKIDCIFQQWIKMKSSITIIIWVFFIISWSITRVLCSMDLRPQGRPTWPTEWLILWQ